MATVQRAQHLFHAPLKGVKQADDTAPEGLFALFLTELPIEAGEGETALAFSLPKLRDPAPGTSAKEEPKGEPEPDRHPPSPQPGRTGFALPRLDDLPEPTVPARTHGFFARPANPAEKERTPSAPPLSVQAEEPSDVLNALLRNLAPSTPSPNETKEKKGRQPAAATAEASRSVRAFEAILPSFRTVDPKIGADREASAPKEGPRPEIPGGPKPAESSELPGRTAPTPPRTPRATLERIVATAQALELAPRRIRLRQAEAKNAPVGARQEAVRAATAAVTISPAAAARLRNPKTGRIAPPQTPHIAPKTATAATGEKSEAIPLQSSHATPRSVAPFDLAAAMRMEPAKPIDLSAPSPKNPTTTETAEPASIAAEGEDPSLPELPDSTPNRERATGPLAPGDNRPEEALRQRIAEARTLVRHFATQLQERIENYRPPFTRMTMTLEPKELGSVELTMIHRGNQLHIQVHSNPGAIGLMATQGQELKNQLVTMGFTDVQMQFSMQQQHQQHQRGGRSFGFEANESPAEEGEEFYDALNIVVPRYI